MNTNKQEFERNKAQRQLKQFRDIEESIRFIVSGLEIGQSMGVAEFDAMTRAFRKLKKLRAEVRGSAGDRSNRQRDAVIGDELARDLAAMRGSQRRAHEQFLHRVAERMEPSK